MTDWTAYPVREVMLSSILMATTARILEEIGGNSELISGLLVIDGDLICIGVIPKSDIVKASHDVGTISFDVLNSCKSPMLFYQAVEIISWRGCVILHHHTLTQYDSKR